MKVSTKEPYQLIYSIFSHEYLGYLFESFVIQLGKNGDLTFQHQNISAKNAAEFADGLDETDYEIIELMDSIQQEAVTTKFQKKVMKPAEFFLKVYDEEKGDKELQKVIADYIDIQKSKILPLLKKKEVYIMGNDGEPAWRKVDASEHKASVLFHFYRNEENTNYFPTIKLAGNKVDFQYNNSQILCNEPAWLLVGEDKIITFNKHIDGKKLKPFLNKKFILVPKKVEDMYYQKFISPIVANFDVYAKGFDIIEENLEPKALLTFKHLSSVNATPDLFDTPKEVSEDFDSKIVFDLSFKYGNFIFSAGNMGRSSVKMEKEEDNFIFHKVARNLHWEKSIIEVVTDNGLIIRNGKASVLKIEGFQWLNTNRNILEQAGIKIEQEVQSSGARYFLGKSQINFEVKESNDWFDINAVVKFGEFEIPFIKLRQYIIAEKREFELPNGEIAIIPEEWLTKYSELFAFTEELENGLMLKKHHLALIQELEEGHAKMSIDGKLKKLRDFESISDYPLPSNFNGTLRPYQQAGYNWLQFLSEFNFGGCLADDMGLGKTVQTLALLADQKQKGALSASLLIMPTSLVYNWQVEASKFAPDLKILIYTGTYRDKNVEQFANYDIIITSYGIARLDIDLLKTYRFNYVILDESQAIKNPTSNISKAVKELNSKSRLILTGTPIENSTMDLWSQLSFANPGLLGSQAFFKKTYLNSIEKKRDEKKVKKLHGLIKPFVLRRHKSQVLTDLPEKVEQLYYSSMSSEQEKEYEEVKSKYRNKIMEEIEDNGMGKSSILLLQGLTKLRQIANHPKLVDGDFEGRSGKMDDACEMLKEAIAGDHKILIFSQFVKYLTLFREELDANGVDYAYLDGSTKARKSQVELFQENEDVKVFLISLKAGGLGLNLTAADYVFILDPWWNPAAEAQAIDRAHRIGQKNTVHTYKFITRNSVEEKILKLQEGKKKLASDLITTEDSFVKSLSKEDINDILS